MRTESPAPENVMDRLSTFDVADPSRDEISASYAPILAAIESASTSDALLEATRAWDDVRRHFETWEALVSIRFAQDTADARNKERQALLDELGAVLKGRDAAVQRALLAHPHAPALVDTYGAQASALWRSEADAHTDAIEESLVAEAKLGSRFGALRSSASVPFRGETKNLSQLLGMRQDPDPATRREALHAFWGWHQEHAEEIDDIYAELVALRDGMAKALGLRDFVELGYLRMQRVDYSREDVAKVRQQVLDYVVPLCAKIRARQAKAHGSDTISYFDEAVLLPDGEPRPRGTTEEKVRAAQEMFDAMDPDLGAFFRVMVDKELLDLDARANKSPGGFCHSFPTLGLPFIFANFDGTKHDVTVFTHEAGHAYQMWSSRDQPLLDYLWATLESCEIHSMSLEYLTWPHMERFFGEDAERFRTVHLSEALTFLPYGCAIDAFQHWVYENPEASAEERRAHWSGLEKAYLPWRTYEDLPLLDAGGLWHRQVHVFQMPFYYIDYVLAGICALQFWRRSVDDPQGALQTYRELCARGGSLPFQELAKSAGLRSPFEDGCLVDVVRAAADELGLS